MRVLGGSRVTELASEIMAQVALLVARTSEGLLRYCVRLITELVFAGTVTVAGGEAAVLVVVAAAVAEEVDGPTTVTRTVSV